MKPKIEELANQSKFFANDERQYLERVHNREYSQDEWQDICFEKFAELIINECVRKVEDMIDTGWYADTEELKKHFGIEE